MWCDIIDFRLPLICVQSKGGYDEHWIMPNRYLSIILSWSVIIFITSHRLCFGFPQMRFELPHEEYFVDWVQQKNPNIMIMGICRRAIPMRIVRIRVHWFRSGATSLLVILFKYRLRYITSVLMYVVSISELIPIHNCLTVAHLLLFIPALFYCTTRRQS